MKKDFVSQFRKSRIAGIPFLAVETPDNFAAISRMASSLKDITPMIQWTNIEGWTGVNDAGKLMLKGDAEKGIPSIFQSGDETDPLNGQDISTTVELVNCLMLAKYLPGINKDTDPIIPGCILFLHNVHEYLTQADISQAILLLREAFRSTNRTLVMVAPEFTFSPQLTQHVKRLIDPLPTAEEITTTVRQMATNSGIEIDEDGLVRAKDALMGLTGFSSKMALAMAFDKKNRSIDFPSLWGSKEDMIRQTNGLRLNKGRTRFAEVKGCTQIKWFCEKLMTGPFPPDLVVIFDEAEKGFAAGTGQNDGGIGKGFLGHVLTEMEENDWGGIINYGPPGTGKTLIAKAVGGELDVPVIFVDLKGMQGGIIGQSEANLRRAFNVIKAMTAGNPLFFMTSNDLDSIPPELKARMGFGTYMFDLPTPEERQQQFELGVTRYGITPENADFNSFNHQDWVGREVVRCCKIARQAGIKLSEAAGQIAPIAVTEAEKIRAIRHQANGRYLSASKPGFYAMAAGATAGRTPLALAAPQSTEPLVVNEDDI